MRQIRSLFYVAAALGMIACKSEGPSELESLNATLRASVEAAADGAGLDGFILPDSKNFDAIPADPANPLTAEKVALGQLLYHETGLATAATDSARAGTYSCATCHHVAAGFKAGVPQGIADGASGFGLVGEARLLNSGLDASAPAGSPLLPDIQPLASPTTLNSAYQEVMLWNGQFGASPASSINTGIDASRLATPGTPKVANTRGLAGLETQAVAGLGVHRLQVETNSVLQTNSTYQTLFAAAFPNSADALQDAALAIAAYERTLLANRAPFQLWLRGDDTAMNAQELRGAILFFGDAGCVGCHTGPALSSRPGATVDQVFHAIGFGDFDLTDERIHGAPDPVAARGRGGFTGVAADDFKFKIPPLYNLADAGFYGHGASFNSIRDVVAYKNAGVAQKPGLEQRLSSLFQPLELTASEIDDLTLFLETGLYDAELQRYVPASLPTGACFPNADTQSVSDLGC